MSRPKTYTLHVPADARSGDAEALEQALVIRDGFSWGAFLFTFLWFFWNRLWLAGIAVAVLVLGTMAGLPLLGVSPGATAAAELLLSFLIGLEAHSLQRWTLRRRKPAVDLVLATSQAEAEAKGFERWLESAPSSYPAYAAKAAPAPSYRAPESVVGLFPDMERAR